MIRKFECKEGVFEFVRPFSRGENQNTFTVIVGKNGTGKSRLLRSVVSNLLPDLIDTGSLTREEVSSLRRTGFLEFDALPSKVICVSTSPFDRFPLLRRDSYCSQYSYLGLRGLSTMSLGMGYMSKIIFTLIGAASNSAVQANAIVSVLEYLGYQNRMNVILKYPSRNFVEELIDSSDPVRTIENKLNQPKFFPTDSNIALRQLQNKPRDELDCLIHILGRMYKLSKRSPKIELRITSEGVDFEGDLLGEPNDLAVLASSGLLQLKEVMFYKSGFSSPIKFHEASSGEQSVVMALLGIGSQICDDAVICIDEPEICLHPEWQEKYIELLFYTFNHYRGCHFIIATHSPQIVAQLPDGNCFIMSMESGLAQDAELYAHRSIDFQLAEVFKAPGFRNEYLSRLALNIFARVSRSKVFDEQSSFEFERLKKMQGELRPEDPLVDLIKALDGMAIKYG